MANGIISLLTDTLNCGLRIRQECRECFLRQQLQRKPLISHPGMHHGTCVTHVPWCISGSLTCGESVPDIRNACATRNFTYLERGPLDIFCVLPDTFAIVSYKGCLSSNRGFIYAIQTQCRISLFATVISWNGAVFSYFGPGCARFSCKKAHQSRRYCWYGSCVLCMVTRVYCVILLIQLRSVEHCIYEHIRGGAKWPTFLDDILICNILICKTRRYRVCVAEWFTQDPYHTSVDKSNWYRLRYSI